MVKSEVIKHLHKKYPELNRAHVETIVDIFFDTIIDSLAKGKSFEARQFGRFSVKTIKEKKNARNPSSGEIIYIQKKL